MLKFWKNIAKLSIPVIVAVCIGITMNIIIISDSIIVLFTKMVIYSLIYILFMWFWGVNNYERELISRPIKQIRERYMRVKKNNA